MNVFSSMVIQNKINAKKTETKQKKNQNKHNVASLLSAMGLGLRAYLGWKDCDYWEFNYASGRNRDKVEEREREKSVRKLQAEDEQEKENESDKR